jgi:hypothetical protein
MFMIIAQRRLSTLTQYLTWFGKSSTSTWKIDIIRYRERIQHTEKDHIHSTPISHCYIGQQLHMAAGLLVAALLSFSFFFLFCSSTIWLSLSHFVLHSWCLFIGFNDSSSCSFVNNGGYSLLMVGAASFDISSCHQQPIIVASFFDNVNRLQILHQQPSLTLTS